MTCVQTDDFSPSQIGVHSTRMSAAITCSWIERPVVALPAVLGHVGPDTGGDLVVDGPDHLDRHALAAHDLDRDVGEALGVRHLGRSLQRAVDEQGPQVGVVGRGRLRQHLLHLVHRHGSHCHANRPTRYMPAAVERGAPRPRDGDAPSSPFDRLHARRRGFAARNPALGEGLGCFAVELVAHEDLRADHPRVVAGLDHVSVTGTDLDLRAACRAPSRLVSSAVSSPTM